MRNSIGENEFQIWKKLNDKNIELNELIDNLNYLRCLIKYGSMLQIAFLFHYDFIKILLEINNSAFFEVWKEKVKAGLNGKDDTFYQKLCKMYYSMANFNIFCTAHIQKSISGVEGRSIKFERTLNNLYSEYDNKGQDLSLLELLQLENTKIAKEFISKICNNDFDKTLGDENKRKYNKTIKNFELFLETTEISHLDDFAKKLNKLNSVLTSDSPDKDRFEEDALELTKSIANIIEYKIINKEEGGAFFLYKYQEQEPQTIVMGKSGDVKLAEICENGLQNLPIIKTTLDGLEYTTENLPTDYDDLTEKERQIKNGYAGESLSYIWTNFSIIKSGDEWIGQNDINYTDDPVIKIINDFGSTRIMLYRVSNKAYKGEALFVFYDKTIKSKRCQQLLLCLDKVRYIHVFRNQISEYFDQNYANDSFRAWIEEKDRANYVFSLNHGLDVYESAVEFYIDNLSKEKGNKKENIKFLEITISYLMNKIYLKSISDKDLKLEDVSFKYIADAFEDDYQYILSFERKKNIGTAPLYSNSYINWTNLLYKEQDIARFSISLLKDIVFETIYNIRKHTLNINYDEISEKSPLKISLYFSEIKNDKYISIKNNFFIDINDDIEVTKRTLNQNKTHGLNLINNLIKKSIDKEIIIDTNENKSEFIINIPINEIK